ncbi:type II toxin-antitoxin system PemK/MazF family toxin [Spirosoma fluminis]
MQVVKWSIYRASLDPIVGSEQGKSRPVLVISDDVINGLLRVVNVLPITSRKENRQIYPNEVLLPVGSTGLLNECIVLCHQIRTLDKQRLTRDYGAVTDPDLQEAVYKALCFQPGIER